MGDDHLARHNEVSNLEYVTFLDLSIMQLESFVLECSLWYMKGISIMQSCVLQC